MITVLDPDSKAGALSVDEIKAELIAADESYNQWGFAGDDGPVGEDCIAKLLVNEPIEWNRISAFQDVTLRLIAEQLLSQHGKKYLSGELMRRHVNLLPPREGYKYHLFVSQHNAGTLDFCEEVSGWLKLRNHPVEVSARQLKVAHAQPGGRQSASRRLKEFSTQVGKRIARGRARAGAGDVNQPGVNEVQVTLSLEELDDCEAMLCYLNGETWTSGKTTEAFANEVATAMRRGIPVILAHEMPGVGGQGERHGVAFSTFFASDATPMELIKAGIYATIAVALKGGAWRQASMVMMVQALAAKPVRNEGKDIKQLSFHSAPVGQRTSLAARKKQGMAAVMRMV